jgi:hypothetical protein
MDLTAIQLRSEFEALKQRRMHQAIALDAVGMSSFLLPGVGEALDIIYGPVFAITLYNLFKVRKGSATVGAATGLIEEWSPGGDILPTATLVWLYQYRFREASTRRKFYEQRVAEQRDAEIAIERAERPGLWTRLQHFFGGQPAVPATREPEDAILIEEKEEDANQSLFSHWDDNASRHT